MTQEATEREQAIHDLRELLKPGDTIYTIMRHVTQSGMRRHISVMGSDPGTAGWFTWATARATGRKVNVGEHEGIVCDGTGMDMGFDLVYSLSRVLFPDGFGCIGDSCPANDHSNGERDYTPHSDAHPHWHTNAGGYALNHRWL